jgi:hypothetical protein
MPVGVYPRSKEHRLKIGLSKRGNTYMRGKKMSDESKEKMRIAANGHHRGIGHEVSEETRKKISLAQVGKRTGSDNNFWKGGKTPLSRSIRTSFQYRQWRSDVFTRDEFTCCECGVVGSRKLVAHHIEPFNILLDKYNIRSLQDSSDCDELWNINNGMTLCCDCHYKTDSYGQKKKGC